MKNDRPSEIVAAVLARLQLGPQDRRRIESDFEFQMFLARFVAALGNDPDAYLDGKFGFHEGGPECLLVGITNSWIVVAEVSTHREANATDRRTSTVFMYRTSALGQIEVLAAPAVEDETSGDWPRRLRLRLHLPDRAIEIPSRSEPGDTETAALLERLRVTCSGCESRTVEPAQD